MRILKAGKKRFVNVVAKEVMEAVRSGVAGDMVCIRNAKKPEKVIYAHGIQIMGPMQLIPDLSQPLPGTEGRGICYVETEAEIRLLTKSECRRLKEQGSGIAVIGA